VRGRVQVLRTVPERQDHLHADLGRFAYSQGRTPGMEPQDCSRHARRWRRQTAGIRCCSRLVRSSQGFRHSSQSEKSEAERLFTELAEGGIVRIPLKETFWADRYGEVTDRFGIPWAISSAKSE